MIRCREPASIRYLRGYLRDRRCTCMVRQRRSTRGSRLTIQVPDNMTFRTAPEIKIRALRPTPWAQEAESTFLIPSRTRACQDPETTIRSVIQNVRRRNMASEASHDQKWAEVSTRRQLQEPMTKGTRLVPDRPLACHLCTMTRRRRKMMRWCLGQETMNLRVRL